MGDWVGLSSCLLQLPCSDGATHWNLEFHTVNTGWTVAAHPAVFIFYYSRIGCQNASRRATKMTELIIAITVRRIPNELNSGTTTMPRAFPV